MIQNEFFLADHTVVLDMQKTLMRVAALENYLQLPSCVFARLCHAYQQHMRGTINDLKKKI